MVAPLSTRRTKTRLEPKAWRAILNRELPDIVEYMRNKQTGIRPNYISIPEGRSLSQRSLGQDDEIAKAASNGFLNSQVRHLRQKIRAHKSRLDVLFQTLRGHRRELGAVTAALREVRLRPNVFGPATTSDSPRTQPGDLIRMEADLVETYNELDATINITAALIDQSETIRDSETNALRELRKQTARPWEQSKTTGLMREIRWTGRSRKSPERVWKCARCCFTPRDVERNLVEPHRVHQFSKCPLHPLGREVCKFSKRFIAAYGITEEELRIIEKREIEYVRKMATLGGVYGPLMEGKDTAGTSGRPTSLAIRRMTSEHRERNNAIDAARDGLPLAVLPLLNTARSNIHRVNDAAAGICEVTRKKSSHCAETPRTPSGSHTQR